MLFVMEEKEHKFLFSCVIIPMFCNQRVFSSLTMWASKIFEWHDGFSCKNSQLYLLS